MSTDGKIDADLLVKNLISTSLCTLHSALCTLHSALCTFLLNSAICSVFNEYSGHTKPI
ncbi:MAG: hypothetical protein FWH27_06090 [Planctomycetaceae bacterium]|nr:hypothetical protein [Planctomycetaceae bacterium]